MLTHDETALLPTVIYDEIIKARDNKAVGRSLAVYVRKSEGDSVSVVRAANWPAAMVVGEGSEVLISGSTYTKTAYTYDKIGYRVAITNEMIEDANWPMVQLAAKWAGEKMAIKESQDIINVITGNAGTKLGRARLWNTTTSGIFNDIATAMRLIEQKDYGANTLVLSPRLYAELRKQDQFRHANLAGTDKTLRTGEVGDVYGLRVIVSNQLASGTMICLDDNATLFFERRPLTARETADSVRDLAGMVLTQRYKSAVIAPSGIVVYTGI